MLSVISETTTEDIIYKNDINPKQTQRFGFIFCQNTQAQTLFYSQTRKQY